MPWCNNLDSRFVAQAQYLASSPQVASAVAEVLQEKPEATAIWRGSAAGFIGRPKFSHLGYSARYDACRAALRGCPGLVDAKISSLPPGRLTAAFLQDKDLKGAWMSE